MAKTPQGTKSEELGCRQAQGCFALVFVARHGIVTDLKYHAKTVLSTEVLGVSLSLTLKQPPPFAPAILAYLHSNQVRVLLPEAEQSISVRSVPESLHFSVTLVQKLLCDKDIGKYLHFEDVSTCARS